MGKPNLQPIDLAREGCIPKVGGTLSDVVLVTFGALIPNKAVIPKDVATFRLYFRFKPHCQRIWQNLLFS